MTHDAEKSRIRRYNVVERGSTAVQALESAWELLRRIEPKIPAAVITLVDARSRRRLHGYFARSTWKKHGGRAHEIGISPELIGHHEELLATMLHEAVHAVLHKAGKNGGIGAGGYYHLREFRDKCQEFGLACEFLNTRYGFTLTFWPDKTVPSRYQSVIALLKQSLPAGTGAPPPRKATARDLPPSGHTLLHCGCEQRNRTVYVKKTVLEVGGIVCAFCKEEFRPFNEPGLRIGSIDK